MKRFKTTSCLMILATGFPALLARAVDDTVRLDASGYVQIAPNYLYTPRSEVREGGYRTEYRAQTRLNLRLDSGPHWSFHAQSRLRYFGGDTVRSIPGYAEIVAHDDGLVDLSWTVFDDRSHLLHVLPDRLYAEWDGGDWNVRLGRQRINWGVALMTNPNDIFNHYSVYDFDYPERPGSDAVRIQRFFGFGTRLEAAVRPDREPDETVAALLFGFHLKGYDIQTIAGRYRDRWTAGLGWAGNLGGAGLKGETTTYHRSDPEPGEREFQTVTAVSLDYMFPNRLFALIELLYNEGGGMDAMATGLERIAPDNPSISKWQTTARLTWPAHPLLDTDLVVMIFPDERGAYLAPSATWSLTPNTDASILGQIFAGRKGSPLADAGYRMILSVKQSF